MARPGIGIEIPGLGVLDVRTLVSDYTGTLSCGGKLVPGVRERLLRLAELLDIHILTSDTFGSVRFELAHIPVNIVVLDGEGHDVQKADFVRTRCDPARVAALGNGNNDRLLLETVRAAGGLAVAVDSGEGCAAEAMRSAHLFIHGAANALDLLLDPRRLKAGLRR